MRGTINALGVLAMCALIAMSFQPAYAADPPDCDSFDIDGSASKPLKNVSLPPDRGSCKVRVSNGFPLPDPDCTPGATNPTLTTQVLRDPAFRTSCVRDSATTAHEKAGTYAWYRIEHPEDNRGVKQICELDHLISLELGGADTLENIWPQCGPDGVVLAERFFKEKDIVENYLAARVKAGSIKLSDAQRGIAMDWTQFLDEAKAACRSGRCKVGE
jgi:hypothetical protein